MWEQVIELFRAYMGTGLIVIWYLVALVYLFFQEKRKPFRILFLYVPTILLLLFFNPWFAQIVYGVVGDEIYYRILWLLPMTMVIAFAVVDIYGKLAEKKRAVFAGVMAVVLACSGSYIYSNPYFSKAENIYHVPQCVVDICDAIEVEGREVMAVFPAEILQYVRQYSPVVCMPYGREQLVDRWGEYDELYAVMEADVVDAEALAMKARYREGVPCHYIILSEDKEMKGDLTDYDYEIFARIDGYIIYKDKTIEL